jgi:DNA-binding SARP family transcriptional activator
LWQPGNRHGPVGPVVAELEDLTRAHPLREQLPGQLMRALAATGRIAQALAAYERLRSTLGGALGTDPSPSLRDLHGALLARSCRRRRRSRAGRSCAGPDQLPRA